ncbi:MAG: hypothetical protein MI784_17105 [Cytophagales bacterium]|nr:hypothetical protein [Cytophagales bacterium]
MDFTAFIVLTMIIFIVTGLALLGGYIETKILFRRVKKVNIKKKNGKVKGYRVTKKGEQYDQDLFLDE